MTEEVFIHPSAEVSPLASIGPGTKIWNNAQVREGARIGPRCMIGKDVYIDKDVVLGRGVRIQNGVSVYKGVTLEDEVFVGPNVTFTNDFRPRAFDDAWTVVPTRLARRCSVGASATIVCGLTLGAYSMISAGAVVTVDTLPHGLYIGNPARLKGFVSKLGFEMAVVHSEDDVIVLECPQTGEEMRIRFEFLEPRGRIAKAGELPE